MISLETKISIILSVINYIKNTLAKSINKETKKIERNNSSIERELQKFQDFEKVKKDQNQKKRQAQLRASKFIESLKQFS